MSNPTAKRKKFYCAAVYTSDAYALDVTDAIAAAGTEPAWQDVEIFKKQLFAKSVNADGYALWAEYIGTPNTVMPANGDISALTDKLQSTGDFTRAAIDALIVATMGKASLGRSRARVVGSGCVWHERRLGKTAQCSQPHQAAACHCGHTCGYQ